MKIRKRDIEEIFAQGEIEAPIEACGYLGGKNGVIKKIFPMRNVDESKDHFSLDPAEQFKVMREARIEGFDILGVYHTHPNSPARPSEEDIKLAYDADKIYVIASLEGGKREAKVFKILEGAVKEEFLEIEQ
ncbi:MAG: hypothetical protein A2452_06060 [Candidatus Firestonebacteria bacterium RIFOXYC2_FULL_39_67]|nr:MAG: hypothetical protein A2536_12405 [Candidatus Firestonebacteria bacterium RIFOXYD2_FULL_39_29]OGF56651.1 MAG: hypothetical protein A2452_06060 [Candidatus Firestonebacteria bacterium RIFOXYC2_FULL_39_67]OGF57126.1 MAG: hypothetical protein A2497_04605 [Candidatus Firestonebacteria bacterium RifOxyC12_full_39_7]